MSVSKKARGRISMTGLERNLSRIGQKLLEMLASSSNKGKMAEGKTKMQIIQGKHTNFNY
jgi:hypothetical protein